MPLGTPPVEVDVGAVEVAVPVEVEVEVGEVVPPDLGIYLIPVVRNDSSVSKRLENEKGSVRGASAQRPDGRCGCEDSRVDGPDRRVSPPDFIEGSADTVPDPAKIRRFTSVLEPEVSA